MKAKITKRLVDSFRAGPADRTVFDTVDLGFVLRVRKTGGMSYAVEYKAGRGPRRADAAGDNRPRRQDDARRGPRSRKEGPWLGRAWRRPGRGKGAASGAPCPSGEVIDAFLAGACRGEAQSLHGGVDARRA